MPKAIGSPLSLFHIHIHNNKCCLQFTISDHRKRLPVTISKLQNVIIIVIYLPYKQEGVLRLMGILDSE